MGHYSTNMKILFIQILLIFVLVCSQYQINDKCISPNGYNATCIPLSECDIIQPLIIAAAEGNMTARKRTRAYQCGYDGEPLICCDKMDVNNPTLMTPVPAHQPIVFRDLESPELPDKSICGVSPPENDRIWGGGITELDEFPWAVAIEYVRKSDNSSAGVKCGGAVISNKWVITAAHCITNHEFKVSKVRLGEWNIKTNPDCYELDLPNPDCADDVQIFNVQREVPHEYFTTRDSNNDIGLLKLSGVITYTKYIRPICLPPPGLPLAELNTYMTVVGWGLTENGTTSDIKLKAELPLVSNSVCKDKIPSKFVSRNHYCVGGEQGKSGCRGDSGGPLMRTFRNSPSEQEQWFLEGIVGASIGCGRLGTPAIYIRVTQYTKWIIDKLAEDKKVNGSVW